MISDFKFAARQLAKRPVFTLVAVLTLALGLTVNISIFGILSTFFFDKLPVKEPEKLAVVLQRSPGTPFPQGHSWLEFQDIRKESHEFEDLLAVVVNPAQLSFAGRAPERTWIELVSGNYFSMLDVRPAVGRLFAEGEGVKQGADSVVVLSYEYWRSKLGADPGIVGQSIRINARPFTVIGIASPTFHSVQWGLAPSAFVPATMLNVLSADGADRLANRRAVMFKVVGRLKSGSTAKAAAVTLNTMAQRLATVYPEEYRDDVFSVIPEIQCRPEPSFSSYMPIIAGVFLVMAVLVLGISCANVANLMFSRAIERQREMAIRSAIGASRGQLLRQLLSESLIIAMLAALVGTVVASWSGDLLRSFNLAGDVPTVALQSHVDIGMILFTVVIATVTGLLTGLAPALGATRIEVQSMLKSSGSGTTTASRHRFRTGLAVSQITSSFVVLVCGGLFLQSLFRISQANLGVRGDHVLMASVDLGLQGYDEAKGRQFHRALLDRLGTLPGVESASLSNATPLDRGMFMNTCEFGAEGKVQATHGSGDDGYRRGAFNAVSPSYLATMGTVLLRGRPFNQQDDEKAPAVALINGIMAKTLWPGEDPIGRRFSLYRGTPYIQVIGVVEDGKYQMLSEQPLPFAYIPLAQHYATPISVQVLTKGDPLSGVADLRKVITSIDADLPVYAVTSFDQHVQSSFFALLPLRMGLVMAGMQGVVGLCLAIMGLYGLMAFTVSQRTREIGIRMAMGADQSDVLKWVMRGGMKMTAIGIGIGLLVAIGMARVLSGLLYGVNAFSLPVLGLVFALVVTISLLASYWPARRATRVNPIEALRIE